MNYVEEEKQQQNEDKLSRGLGISFAIHAILISFFALKAAFLDPEPIDFSQAVRVDMVGLPEKLKQLPDSAKENAKPALPEKEKPAEKPVEKVAEKKPEPKATPKPVPAKVEVKPKTVAKDGVNLEKTKSQQQNALEKLKALAALEKIKQEVSQQKKAAPPIGTGQDKTGAKVKGNVISPGTALSGLSKLQHDTYAADLDKHIKDHWQLPEWLANQGLKAQARVFINAQGQILGKKIVKSSGNQSYDDEVLATIDKSNPLPPPPEKFTSLVEVDGILIGFPE